jgi:hypothetical protein
MSGQLATTPQPLAFACLVCMDSIDVAELEGSRYVSKSDHTRIIDRICSENEN